MSPPLARGAVTGAVRELLFVAVGETGQDGVFRRRLEGPAPPGGTQARAGFPGVTGSEEKPAVDLCA